MKFTIRNNTKQALQTEGIINGVVTPLNIPARGTREADDLTALTRAHAASKLVSITENPPAVPPPAADPAPASERRDAPAPAPAAASGEVSDPSDDEGKARRTRPSR